MPYALTDVASVYIISVSLRGYRYYVCTSAQKRGWSQCPSPSVPAGELERFVVDQLRGSGADAGLVRDVAAATHTEAEFARKRLRAEQRALRRQLSALSRKVA